MTPAQRKRLSADTRRSQLERATIDVIGRAGVAAATAEAIANAAGVSKGLLWRYYADLEGLMIGAARRAFADLEAAVSVDVDLESSAGSLFSDAIHRAARLPTTHPDELRTVRQVGAAHMSADGDATQRASEYRGLHSRQAKLVRRFQERGEIRPGLDADLVAITYQGMVDTMLDLLDADPEQDPAAVADHVADIFLGGIGPRPGTENSRA